MSGRDRVRLVDQERLPAAIAVAGRLLARDVDGRSVALPASLGGDHARRPEDVDHLTRLHSRDRPRNARAWADAINDPGRVYTVDAWVRVGDRWLYRRFDYCNLLHEATIGVVLVGVTALEPEVIDPPPQPMAMTHEPARWSILRIGPLGRILRAEGTVDDLYGRTVDELVGMNGLTLIHPDDHEALLDAWADVVEGGSAGRALRQRVVSASGAVTWVLASIGRPDPDGSVMIHDLDISAQLAAEEALRTSEERLRKLARDLPVGVFVSDSDGWFEFTNEACSELLGGSACFDEFLDTSTTRWATILDTATRHGEVSVDCPTPDGRLLRIRCQAPLPDGTVSGVVEDVTSSARWREEASRDALTGLANRAALSREITRRIAADATSLVAFIDLDSFKRVNDLHGHDEGDRVLIRVGEALRGMIRDGDIAGRWGGDEFVLLTGDLPPDAQSDLRRRVDASMATCGAGGASIGFTALRPDDDVRAVITRADRAMYADKRRSSADAPRT